MIKVISIVNYYSCRKTWTCAMNLQELIKGGESETLEFKEKFDERTVESVVLLPTQRAV
jgi:hypothetical protein